MKKEWSPKWNSSVQPRKQRKYLYNAPLHVRQRLLSANLSPELRKRFGKRSMQPRKGDEVKVMRGGFKGKLGTIESVSLSKGTIIIDEVKIKKVDGSDIHKPLQPSNLMITKLKLDDKKRQAIIDRAEQAKKPKAEKPKVEKAEPKKEKPKETKKPEPKKPEKKAAKPKAKPAAKKPEKKAVKK